MPVIDHLSLYKLVLSNLYKLQESRIVCPLTVTNTVVIMITGMAFYAIGVSDVLAPAWPESPGLGLRKL